MKLRWELTKLLKARTIIAIKPTMRCNLNCWYCAVFEASKIYNVKYKTPPKYKELPPEYWMKLIKRVKPDLIVFSGGEPAIYKGFADIVNYAVKQKCLVQILSNLTVMDEFNKIKPSWRICFLHTTHEGTNPENVRELSKSFHVTVRTLSDNAKKKSRHEKPIIKDIVTEFKLMYAPDGTLYDSCDGASLGSNVVVTNCIEL